MHGDLPDAPGGNGRTDGAQTELLESRGRERILVAGTVTRLTVDFLTAP